MASLTHEGVRWTNSVNNENHKKRLVGRIISKKKINLVGIKEQLKAAWGTKEDFVISNITTNLFSFTFDNPDEATKVMDESPWMVRNHMLSLQYRGHFMPDYEVKINSCPFWVQLHNIPPEALLRENLLYFGNRIGKVLSLEMPGEGKFNFRKFGRLRIEVDVDKPLTPGFMINRPPIYNNVLEPIWIQVKYEKLQRFCFLCGKLGHESKDCDFDEDELCNLDHRDRYNSKMCTPPLKFRPPSPENSFRSVPGHGPSQESPREDVRNYCMHGKSHNCNQCLALLPNEIRGTHVSLSHDRTSGHSNSPRAILPSESNTISSTIELGVRSRHSMEVDRLDSLMRQSNESYVNIWANIRLTPREPTSVQIHDLSTMDSPSRDNNISLPRGPLSIVSRAGTSESSFLHTSPPPSSHNSAEVLSLVNQVAHVHLKRKADDLRESPIPKRTKHNEKCSPSFAEKNRRASLFLDQHLPKLSHHSSPPGTATFSHENKSPTDLRRPYNGYELIFNMGQVENRKPSSKFSLSRTRRKLFPPPGESSSSLPASTSSNASRDGGWPSPATTPQ